MPLTLKHITAIAILLASCAQDISAQYADTYDGFLGQWKGIITQESGPTTRYFDMEMSVARVLESDSIYTISSHVMDGDYHAYMVGDAIRTPDGQLYIAEREIIRSDTIPGMEWCIKRLQLNQSLEQGDLHLRGVWSGDTTFGACEPGKMDLVREVIRP